MKGLAESSPFRLLTNPHVINRFIFGHGVFIYYIYWSTAGSGYTHEKTSHYIKAIVFWSSYMQSTMLLFVYVSFIIFKTRKLQQISILHKLHNITVPVTFMNFSHRKFSTFHITFYD